MFKSRRFGTLSACLSSLFAFIALSSVALNVNAQIERLDHFSCYRAEGPRINQLARLQDQFDVMDQQLDLALIARPFQFCNPADKIPAGGTVTPIIHPTNHLTFYLMLDFPPGPSREVTIINQFGEQRLRVPGWAFFLAVPTEKNAEGKPEDLDHFKCYRARGEPLNLTVRLLDQFFPNGREVEVREPDLLCNPVVKRHAGATTPIGNEEAHLVCYLTTRTPFEGEIRTDNQFVDAGPLRIGPAQRLCVPSKKQVVNK
jgi:hypothetical protein